MIIKILRSMANASGSKIILMGMITGMLLMIGAAILETMFPESRIDDVFGLGGCAAIGVGVVLGVAKMPIDD